MTSLLIRNARIGDDAPADILIRDGKIAEIARDIAADGVPVENADGHIAIAGLVDAHTHLDKSLLGWPWYKNDVGGASLMAMIENERAMKKKLGIE